MGIAAVAVTGVLLYAFSRKKNKRMLTQIANEGYETAHDILFPSKPAKNKNLRYGPVHPGTQYS